MRTPNPNPMLEHQHTREINAIFIHSALDDAGLTPDAFRIYAHLARRMNSANGKAWPSLRSMAAVCLMSKNTVIKALEELQARQMLTKEAGGGDTSNRYILTPASAWTAKVFEKIPTGSGDEPVQEMNRGGSGDEQGAVHVVNTKDIQSKDIQEGKTTSSEDLFCMSEKEPQQSKPTVPFEQIKQTWNQRVVGLRKCTAINGKRETLVRARFADLGHSLEAWAAFCDTVEASDFLTGRAPMKTAKPWTADFDWCILPTNFAKIREGKYNKPDPKPAPKTYGW